MIPRLARITVAGIPRVVDLLSASPPSAGGFAQGGFGTAPFGGGNNSQPDGGFTTSPFATAPFGGSPTT